MIATVEMSSSCKSLDVAVNLRDVSLEGTLTVPRNAVGAVIFAHGSGSSRFSPRTHLFEEPGKLERVAQLAREWFLQHLQRA